jgi:hypothetical protein
MFKNGVLRGIFGPKRNEVTGQRKMLQNGELHNLCSSPNIIKQITSRKIKDRMGGACGTHGRGKCSMFWWECPKERDHSED